MTRLHSVEENSVLHLRVEGKSEELPLEDLDLSVHSSDTDIRRALASHFAKPTTFFDTHAIDRSETGITVRPQAIFG